MTGSKPVAPRAVTFVILVLALGVAAILARKVMGARARAARSDVAAVVQGLGVPLDTATATPGFERARARRLAVAQMRAMLTALVKAEAAVIIPDSLRPEGPRTIGNLPPGWWSNWDVKDGNWETWVGWTRHLHADDVWCAVAVGPHTADIGHAPPGVPVCFSDKIPMPDWTKLEEASMRDYRRWQKVHPPS